MSEVPRKSVKEKVSDFARKYVSNIEIGGRRAEVADVSPETPSGKRPVLLAPGWASTIPVYTPALETLAQNGRRALTLNHPRLALGRTLSEEDIEKLKGFPPEELRNATNLIDLLDAKGIKEIDVIAHSEGSINTLAAALIRPDLFKNIVLYGPPGFIGEDSKLRLAQGWASFVKKGAEGLPSMKALPVTDEMRRAAEAEGRTISQYKEIERTDTSRYVGGKSLTEGAKYVAKNPLRAIREAAGMASIDLTEAVRTLRSHGIKVAIMSGVDDDIFSTEKMAERFDKGEIDGFYSMRGGHGQFNEFPEHYIAFAEDLLSKMDRKTG